LGFPAIGRFQKRTVAWLLADWTLRFKLSFIAAATATHATLFQARQRLGVRTWCLWLCTPSSFVLWRHCRGCWAHTVAVASSVLIRRGHERVARVKWIRERHLHWWLGRLRVVWSMRRRGRGL